MEKNQYIQLSKFLETQGIEDEKDVELFLNCKNQTDLKFQMTEFGILPSDFKQLSSLVLDPLREKEADTSQIFEKDRRMFVYMIDNLIILQKIPGDFSAKYLARLEMKTFISKHPQLHKQKEEDIKKIGGDLQQDIRLFEQTLKLQKKMNQAIESAFLQMKSLDPASVQSAVLKIKRQLMPLDINYLSKLIAGSINSGSRIANQSGIIFIGVTGSGKSTLMLKLLGNKMVKSLWNGQQWVTTKSPITDPQAKNLIANPSTVSVTREVTAVALKPDVLNQLQINYSGQLFLIDTPGFQDTQGPIMDLANAFGVSQAIRGLMQARFVIVMSGLGRGERYQFIKRMCNILNDLFPVYKEVSRSVSFLFNRFQDGLDEVNAKTTQHKQSLNEIQKQNSNLRDIYFDFLKKTTKQQIRSYNILTDDPIALLQKIGDNESVQGLRKLFNISYGTQAIKAIQEQVRILRDQCMTYFQAGNFQICSYFLSQLKTLYIIMGEDAPPIVLQTLNSLKEGFTVQIQQSVIENIKNLTNRVDNLSVTAQDIQKYKKLVEQASDYLCLTEQVEIPDIKSQLTQNAQDKINVFVNKIKISQNDITSQEINVLKLLVNNFGEEKSLEEINNHYKGKGVEILKNYEVAICEDRLSDAVKHYKQYDSVGVLLGYLTGNNVSQAEATIDKVITDQITAQMNRVSPIQFARCKDQDFSKISKVSKKLKTIQKSNEYLGLVRNSQQIERLFGAFQEDLSLKAIQVLDGIKEYITGISTKSLNRETEENIINNYKKIKLMKIIPHLETLVQRIEMNISNSLRVYLGNQKQVLADLIAVIGQKRVNLQGLTRQIDSIDQATKRIERLSKLDDSENENQLYEILQKLQEFLNDHLYNMKEIRGKLDFTKQDADKDMETLSRAFEALNAFRLDKRLGQQTSKLFKSKQLKQTYDTLQNSCMEILGNIIKKAEDITLKLKKMRQNEENSTEKYKEMRLNQLNACLKFLLMGSDLFRVMQSQMCEFKTAYQNLSKETKEWSVYYLDSITRQMMMLRDTDNSVVKATCRSLKRKLQVLQEVDQKWIQIKDAAKFQYSNYLYDSVQQQLTQVHDQLKNNLQLYNKASNKDGEIKTLIQMCRTLSKLDRYFSTGDTFLNLESEARKVQERRIQNRLKVFQDALSEENIELVCQMYLKLREVQCNSWIQFKVQGVFKKILNRAKSNLFLQSDDIPFMTQVQGNQKLAKAIFQLQKIASHLGCQVRLQNCLTDMKDTYNYGTNNINTYANHLQILTGNLIQQKCIQQALDEVKNLEVLEKMYVDQKAKLKGSKQFANKISEYLMGLEEQYVKNKKLDFNLSGIKKHYNPLFTTTKLTSIRLIQLKDKIDQTILYHIQKATTLNSTKDELIGMMQRSKNLQQHSVKKQNKCGLQ